MSAEYLVLLFGAMCLVVLGMLILCAFWRSLELTRKSDDSRRYPRYGKSDDMKKPRT